MNLHVIYLSAALCPSERIVPIASVLGNSSNLRQFIKALRHISSLIKRHHGDCNGLDYGAKKDDRHHAAI